MMPTLVSTTSNAILAPVVADDIDFGVGDVVDDVDGKGLDETPMAALIKLCGASIHGRSCCPLRRSPRSMPSRCPTVPTAATAAPTLPTYVVLTSAPFNKY